MFIEFSVKNYRSYKDKVTFSMVAGSGNELPDHVFETCDLKGLRSSVIFGANASGKSNLIYAIRFMRFFVLTSQTKTTSDQTIPTEPFLLSSADRNAPSEFEAVFLIAGFIYRYGFSVNSERVLTEWLVARECKPYKQEVTIIERNLDEYTLYKDIESNKIAVKYLKDLLRPNALLIGLLDQINYPHAKNVVRLMNSLYIETGSRYLRGSSISQIKNGSVPEKWIDRFMQVSDVGIERVQVETLNSDEASDKNAPHLLTNLFPNTRILTSHKFYNELTCDYETVSFDLDRQESKGTQRLFDLAVIMYLVLKKGNVLLIDEIDTSLHYFLTRIVIELFQNPKTNPNNAQLIFTTHNITHLDRRNFRRDEIWFVDKDNQNSSQVYSLSEFKVRKDASFDLDYLRGRYKAVPIVDFESFAELLSEESHD